MGAHPNTWGFWLGVELPVVVFAVLLLILSRKRLRERRQRIWMAGFVVVLCVLGAGVALLTQVSMQEVCAVRLVGDRVLRDGLVAEIHG